MQQISTAEFKNGMGLKIKDKIYTLVEFQHVKPGKGGAFVRYKIKDLRSGRVIGDQTCNAGSKFDSVMLSTKEMQYLYNDGDNYYFMDMSTYEQIPVPADFIGDNAKWLKENDVCQLMYADDDLLTVQPPMFIEVEIHQDRPGLQGRHRPGRRQAGYGRDGRRHPGADVPQRGRGHQDRHPRGQVRLPRLASINGPACHLSARGRFRTERGSHEQ